MAPNNARVASRGSRYPLTPIRVGMIGPSINPVKELHVGLTVGIEMQILLNLHRATLFLILLACFIPNRLLWH